MEPSPKHVEEFKKIYKQENGEDISDEKAYDEVRRVIGLAELGLEDYFRNIQKEN